MCGHECIRVWEGEGVCMDMHVCVCMEARECAQILAFMKGIVSHIELGCVRRIEGRERRNQIRQRSRTTLRHEIVVW